MGSKDGSIIATIITTHIPMNDAAAADQVRPGICIQAIDMVQPPGIAIPPIADMDAQHAIVAAALTAKSSAHAPKNACRETRAQWLDANVVGIMLVARHSRNVASLASDTSTHFGSGEASTA